RLPALTNLRSSAPPCKDPGRSPPAGPSPNYFYFRPTPCLPPLAGRRRRQRFLWMAYRNLNRKSPSAVAQPGIVILVDSSPYLLPMVRIRRDRPLSERYRRSVEHSWALTLNNVVRASNLEVRVRGC